jgi:hypothetical protein
MLAESLAPVMAKVSGGREAGRFRTSGLASDRRGRRRGTQYHVYRGRKQRAQQNRTVRPRGTIALRRWTSGPFQCALRRNWYYSALKWSRGTPRPGSGTGATARPRQLGIGLAGSPRRAALAEPHAASTSLLSQRPIHPHRPGPTPRAFVAPQSGSETASWTCLRAACGLRARLGLSAAATCLLGPCCNDRTPLEPLCSV